MQNKILIILLFTICSLANILANEATANEVKKTDEYVHIIGKERQVKISFLNQYTAKITPLFVNDTILNTSYAVRRKPAKKILKFTEDDEYYFISSDSIIVQLDKQDLLITVIDKISGDTLMRKINYVRPHNYKGFRCHIDSSLAVYGVASQLTRYNKNRNYLYFINHAVCGYKFPEDNISMNMCVPYYSFGNKFSMFIDNPATSYSGMGMNTFENFYFFADDLQPDIYLLNKAGLSDIVKEYYDLTGYQPLPPMWSLGFLQSSMFLRSSEVIACIERFKEHEMPLETIIMDLMWFGEAYKMGNLSWNEDGRWDNYQEMLDTMEKNEIKKVLVSEPYISRKSKNYPYGVEKNYFVRAGADTILFANMFYNKMALVDLTNPEAKSWFIGLYKDVSTKSKIDGWWMDTGEPETHPSDSKHYDGKACNVHNPYSNYWSKALADSMIIWRDNRRPFLLSRGGWAGIHNNYVFNWSGDCFSNYSTMYIQSPMNLSAGICGIGYYHSDLGGYHSEKSEFSSRLYTRWMQFGTFSPVMRAHSSSSHPPFPFFHGDEATAICRNFMNLRYALLPYIYTMAYENSTKGYPLCRAMNYYENTERFRETDDQYYFGRDILVAPIFDSTDSRKVLFPKGKWINFFTLNAYEGDSEAEVKADLSQMPLFIRAGAIIPNSTKIMNTAYYSRDTLLLNYYYDSTVTKSEGYVYIDDGISINSIENKQYEIVSFSAEVKDTNIVLHIKRNTNNWKEAPKDRVYIINIISKDTISGRAFVLGDTTCTRGRRYANTTAYTMPRIAGNAKINIGKVGELEPEPEPNPDDTSNVYEYRLNHIFPNPIEDEINIPLDDIEIGAYTLQIFSAKGEKVLELNDYAPILCEMLSINLINKYGYNPLADGAYYALLRSGNKSYKFQFVKKSR